MCADDGRVVLSDSFLYGGSPVFLGLDSTFPVSVHVLSNCPTSHLQPSDPLNKNGFRSSKVLGRRTYFKPLAADEPDELWHCCSVLSPNRCSCSSLVIGSVPLDVPILS